MLIEPKRNLDSVEYIVTDPDTGHVRREWSYRDFTRDTPDLAIECDVYSVVATEDEHGRRHYWRRRHELCLRRPLKSRPPKPLPRVKTIGTFRMGAKYKDATGQIYRATGTDFGGLVIYLQGVRPHDRIVCYWHDKLEEA